MKSLMLSLCTLGMFLYNPWASTEAASADIIPPCQWHSEHYTKYYVTKRANVRDAPNTQGKVVATLSPGSIVYTNEKTRTPSGNSENWYILLATTDLPAILGCAGGFIHPSLVSTTPPSTQQAETSPSSERTIAYSNGDRYRGQVRRGIPHGRGLYTWASGSRYEGEFRDGKRHGRGTITYYDGRRFEGEWGDDKWLGGREVASQQAEQPKGGDQQRGDISGDKGALWGAIVLSSHWGDYSNDKNYAVAWNYPSQSTAIEAAIDRCASRTRWGDCGRNGVYYSREDGYASHVAFSSAAQRHDSIVDSNDNPGTSYLGAALASKHMGISAVVRHKCVLVWSELETRTDGYASIPLAVFAATETKARTVFSTYWSKSAIVSSSWRDELKVYCNDH